MNNIGGGMVKDELVVVLHLIWINLNYLLSHSIMLPMKFRIINY